MYPGSSFRMTEDVLEIFTKQYIQAQSVPEVTFGWQGGEPTLMGIEFFKKALTYQEKYQKLGIHINNSLQTNGILLDDAWGSFLKENNFLVGISIDGPKDFHDIFRKDRGGKPSFDLVILGLEVLKKHQVDYNVLTTVHAANADHPLKVYRFLRDEIGADFIQFIPIVERDNKTGYQKGNKITKRSVTGKQYGSFLISIFDEWVRNDVGKIFVQIFDVALGKWWGAKGGLCIFEETCGMGLALEHNGDLYACDHYVEPRWRLGSILKTDMAQMVGLHKQKKFGLDKRDTLPKYCRKCNVLFACNGGCPKNRVLHTQDGEYGLNYLCEGYKSFFPHVGPSMKIMATLIQQGRPPALIMETFATEN